MPANLSPDYKAAEAAFRKARDPEERLGCLKEMLRTIPKHKGTEHLQGDIKARIKQLTEELAAPKKGGARGGPATVIRAEGAAQIALLGAPNAGKSALHSRLTGSHAEVGPYPFSTHYPMPGMLAHEDINFQLLDLPPISPDHPVPWIANTLQPADAALLVVDLCEAACVEQVLGVHELLAARRVRLLASWDRADAPGADDEDYDPFAVHLPTLMLIAKADLLADVDAELAVFRELANLDYPALACSVQTGEGLDRLGPWLFEHLGVVRVYTKAPGRPADMGQPFTVRRGDTVHDVALHIHKDIAQGLKYARLWGQSGQFSGQQVGREHHVADGDVLEIHV
jgi:ribosome-interacting GTPase 1